MSQFTQSLRFKLTLLVIAVELLIFSGAGAFYTHRFSQEIDNAIIARLSIPGLLMSRGELSFDAVSDTRTMEGVLREPYSEGVVIGLDGRVYFSSNPARLDRHLDEIDGLQLPRPESPDISVAAHDLITPVQDSSGTYLTCLSPLRPNGKLAGYLYLKVGTAISEAEKRKVALLFALGSLGTIALTALILSWLLHRMVVRRLNELVEIFRRFARGDYAIRAHLSGGDDEIVALMNGFNGLAKRLEDTLAHLRESETLLNTTQRLSKVGGWEVDVKSGKAYWTDELYRIHEIPNDPGIDHIKESMACYEPEDRLILNEVFQRACEQGEPYDLELPFTTCKGTPLWIRTTAQPVYENGKVVRLVGNLMDITERKRAEEALRFSSERLQLATRVANIGVWDWDIPKNELAWDDSMYQLYGLQKGDFGGAYDAWISTLYPEDKVRVDGEIQAALRGEREYAPEFRIVRKDGSIRHIKADSRTSRDQDGKPLRMIGTNIDITELKLAETRIRTLNQELEQRVAERTAQLETAVYDLENFNYSASHDLRIPLRAVDGFSRILMEEYSPRLDEEGNRLLKVVRDNTQKIAQYIDDMLAFSSTGRMLMLSAEIDMSALVREVMDELNPAIAARDLKVVINPLPPIIADRVMMRRVMLSLLANAVKFTRLKAVAQIEVGAKTEGMEIVFFVRDNGVGFDMQYADKLFGVFQRLHGVGEFEGTGIGLAIVKRIITRHGGRVWAEGKVNEGATVYFSIPLAAAPQKGGA
jgi:PAS domain S-box-containing protein